MLRIISDGTPQGTQVFTALGEELRGVTQVSWTIEPDRTATATLTLERVKVDAAASRIVLARPKKKLRLK